MWIYGALTSRDKSSSVLQSPFIYTGIAICSIAISDSRAPFYALVYLDLYLVNNPLYWILQDQITGGHFVVPLTLSQALGLQRKIYLSIYILNTYIYIYQIDWYVYISICTYICIYTIYKFILVDIYINIFYIIIIYIYMYCEPIKVLKENYVLVKIFNF